MIRDLFVYVENELWPMAAESVRAAMPDVLVNYITHDDRTLPGPAIRVGAMDDAALGTALKHEGYSGICFVVPSSALVLRDFRPSMPPPAQLARFYRGMSRRYMHAGEHAHATRYDDMGVDYNATCDRVRFINLDLLGCAVDERRTIKMSLKMRYGADPLVLEVLDGHKLVEFSRDALKAHVIDFGRELLDPGMTVDECYAYPFDVYGDAAGRVKEHLPAAVYDVIQRSANRTRVISPLRNVLI